MLKANELRLNNWVNISGSYIQLAGEKFLYILEQDGMFTRCDGIPLTPEILEKAGFVKADIKQNDNIEFTAYSSNAVDKDIFSIRIDRMKELQRVLVVPVFKNIALPMHLNTVHQLQNLYFALTGTELEINL